MIKNKSTLILISVLAICILVLVVLAFLVVKNAILPVLQPNPQWIELPALEDKPLSDAKQMLDELGISYEIIPTDSIIANRVEKIEYAGKQEDGKDFLELGHTVTLFANEISADKVVYLTFDDGPTMSNTFDILDTLDTYGAKATFFVLGNRIREYSDRILATDARGHIVACHSYSHDLDRASSGFVYASVSAMLSEIEKYENALKSVLGEESFSKLPKLMRFPGGSSTNGRISKSEALDYIAAVRSAGYRVYDWTALTGDAEGKSTANEFIAYLESGLDKAKNSKKPLIILMHDKLTTSEALPQILDYLVEGGYYFSTLDTCPEYTFAEN